MRSDREFWNEVRRQVLNGDFPRCSLEDDFARTKVLRHEKIETGHGREEQRKFYICPVPDDRPSREHWTGLKAIGTAINDTLRNRVNCGEVRHSILSQFVAGKRPAPASSASAC